MQPPSKTAQDKTNELFLDFLNNLPEDIPAEVKLALRDSVMVDDKKIPPRLFYEIVDQLAIAISITDTQANILYCNPIFESLSGYEKGELLGQNHSLLSYKKTPLEVYRSLWSTVTSGRKWNGTLLNKRKDGTPYLADLTVAPVFDSQNQIRYYLGIHRDVTDQMSLERRLMNQKSLLETVIDDAPMVICVLDEAGSVIVENHGYKVLMSEFQGQEPSKSIITAVEENLGKSFEEIRENRLNFDTIEIRFEMGGFKAPKWYSVSGTWMDNIKIDPDSYYDWATTGGLLLICNDITKRRYHFEQAKSNAIKALMAEKQMMQGMNEVISGSIFQLQGPLNMISAAAAMVDRGVSDPLTLKTMLKEVQQAGEEALSKLKACMPKVSDEGNGPVSINVIVREVLDISTEKFLSDGIRVSWKPTPVVPSIFGQSNALRSMVKHLLDNAITAINEPGSTGRDITIVTSVTEDESVELIMTDKGCGISESCRPNIFEPFFSEWKRAKGRSGMGLAIVQQVLSEHGGTIDVSPVLGGGTRVHLTFSNDAEF